MKQATPMWVFVVVIGLLCLMGSAIEWNLKQRDKAITALSNQVAQLTQRLPSENCIESRPYMPPDDHGMTNFELRLVPVGCDTCAVRIIMIPMQNKRVIELSYSVSTNGITSGAK